MPPPLPQHLHLWAGLKLISVSWLLGPSPIPGLSFWQGFHFLPGGVFPEVQNVVAVTQPHSEMWSRIHTYSSSDYGTLQFHFSCFPESKDQSEK